MRLGVSCENRVIIPRYGVRVPANERPVHGCTVRVVFYRITGHRDNYFRSTRVYTCVYLIF